jgi:cyclohexanone monooxygenase
MMRPMSTAPPDDMSELDVVIVGAGFAGLYAIHRLRGLGYTLRCFEAGQGVGGTWYWNRYPGARCDVESLEYSYSFSPELEQEWEWTERYASQPEILRYLEHVAERFELKRDISFGTRVTSAIFDEAGARWLVETEHGDRVAARFCIMATGCLSEPRLPDLPGLERYQGRVYNTARWPHEGVDFTGERVAVIGTGSSGIQSIPVIASQAASLTVFQRTPNYSVPAYNGPIDPELVRWFKANSAQIREDARNSLGGFAASDARNPEPAMEASAEERERAYQESWERGGLPFMFTFPDLQIDPAANETAAEFLRGKIRSIVRDPKVAETLMPRDYPAFTKRLCVDTRYFETFNQPHVALVDLRRTPIEEATASGLRTSDAEFEFDSLVFATGFDAMTGALNAIDIVGRNGVRLKDNWNDGPRAYLGLMSAGFPNLFLVTGPGSPSVLSNMVVSIEQHVDWIADCLDWLDRHGRPTIEADPEAEAQWAAHVVELGDATLFPRAASWYMGANVPGKPRTFMPYVGGVAPYRQKCNEVAAAGYAGFRIGEPRAATETAEFPASA